MEPVAQNELKVTYKSLPSLKSSPRNARTHSKTQIRMIANSIKTFGFTNPVLVDRDNNIMAGHGRVEAAKSVKLTEVPTICLEGLTAEQLRAYMIADNRLAEQAGWDASILAIELQELLSLDLDFDIGATGFQVPEIDMILAEARTERDADDVFEATETAAAVSGPGDIWRLGKHRILCGNSLEESSFTLLMADRKANVVFTDPPYNVAIDGHAGGLGSIHHREFTMASGDMSEAQFVAFLTSSLTLLAKHSVNGAVHYICMDWRHIGELLTAGQQAYDCFLNVCIWVKNNGGMGSFYRSRHEFVFVFRNGKGKHQNNIQLGQYGRNRTNVWEYPSINSVSKTGDESNLLALHPTVKPVNLIADALLDCSARGDVALDGFLGSGSTLIAAERTGRICYGIELDPLYVDTAIRRWERHTGGHAIHSVNGKRFEEVAKDRLEVAANE